MYHIWANYSTSPFLLRSLLYYHRSRLQNFRCVQVWRFFRKFTHIFESPIKPSIKEILCSISNICFGLGNMLVNNNLILILLREKEMSLFFITTISLFIFDIVCSCINLSVMFHPSLSVLFLFSSNTFFSFINLSVMFHQCCSYFSLILFFPSLIFL